MRKAAQPGAGALRTAAVSALRNVSHSKSMVAPIGGWNARDPIAAMKPQYALVLDNWIPRVGDCTIREGCANHLTGLAQRTKTLVKYTPPTAANNKMYACNDSGIFDASIAGAVGAAVKACTNGYFNWTQMGVSGGHYLMMFNGTDAPIYFDGTTWISITAVSVPALTGVTTTDLISPCVYKRRLILLEKNKLNFWYLAADAVGGALTQFLLGPLAQKGGYTMAAINWSFDGGDGPDDYIVFLTSEGEAIVFSGTNPAVAADWSLVGVYFVGKPIGRKPMVKYGGDVLCITEFGILPLSKALQSANIDYKQAITNVIEKAFVDAARVYGSVPGWEMTFLPNRSLLICNIPNVEGSTYYQYVMNTTTKAWCRFTNWAASCFLDFNSALYFGDATKVAAAFSGRSDYGSNIVATGQTAYSYFGDKSSKEWKLYRPMLLVDGGIAFQIGLSVDFRPVPALSEATYSVQSGAIWDVDNWDESYWAAGLEVVQDWRTPSAYTGFCASGLLKITTNSLEVQWAANDYIYERGSLMS